MKFLLLLCGCYIELKVHNISILHILMKQEQNERVKNVNGLVQ